MHSDGTPAEAGDVVDEGNLLLVIVVWGDALHGSLSVAISERLAIIVVGRIAESAVRGIASEI